MHLFMKQKTTELFAEYLSVVSSVPLRAVPCVSDTLQGSSDVRRVRFEGWVGSNLSLGRTEPQSQTRVLAFDVAATLRTRPHLVHV